MKTILDKRKWKWSTTKNYNYWYCYFTKYGYITRLVKVMNKEKRNEVN